MSQKRHGLTNHSIRDIAALPDERIRVGVFEVSVALERGHITASVDTVFASVCRPQLDGEPLCTEILAEPVCVRSCVCVRGGGVGGWCVIRGEKMG